jgi:hypothetical protein
MVDGYLPEAARFSTTSATASWPVDRLAARFEVDRAGQAMLLLAFDVHVGQLPDHLVERAGARHAVLGEGDELTGDLGGE